jgi:hypothetical protein
MTSLESRKPIKSTVSWFLISLCVYAVLVVFICCVYLLMRKTGSTHVSSIDNDHQSGWKLSTYMSPDYKLIEDVIVLSNEKKPQSEEAWPSIDIIFPVVWKDAALLIWFINSVEVFFPHYNEVILIIEKDDAYILRGVVPYNRGRYKAIIVNDPFAAAGKAQGQKFGYLTQQWYKFFTDQMSTASYSMILESDSIFMRKPLISDFFEKSSTGQLLPITVIIDHKQDTIPHCKSASLEKCEGLIWKAGAEYAFNGRDKLPTDTDETFKEAKFEYMHWLPFIYPNKMFKALRDHITHVHNKPFQQFFDHYTNGMKWQIDGKSDKMSEFNIIGYEFIQICN